MIHTLMSKVVVTFKLKEEIYSKLKAIAEKEGRGVSEILRESLTDWLQNKKYVSTPDLISRNIISRISSSNDMGFL